MSCLIIILLLCCCNNGCDNGVLGDSTHRCSRRRDRDLCNLVRGCSSTDCDYDNNCDNNLENSCNACSNDFDDPIINPYAQ